MKFNYLIQNFSIDCINIFFLGLCGMILTNCNTSEFEYEPCKRHYELESLKPSDHSMDWIPYHTGQTLIATNQSGSTIPFKVDSFPVISKSDRSFFEIPCYEDSSQTNQVFYSSFIYQLKLINQTEFLPIREIHITLYVFLDEINSRLDQLKMADILEIYFVSNNGNPLDEKIRTLRFPVLDRGVSNIFKSNFRFFSNLIISGKNFEQVYTNYEINEKFKVFYSDKGLLGFELPDGIQYTF